MTKQEVIDLIQLWIIANGNEEITADVLRPILEAMVNQPNDLIGDLDNLTTAYQTDLVGAINEVRALAVDNSGVIIYYGTDLPDAHSFPSILTPANFYVQLDGSTVLGMWAYNGNEWIAQIPQRTKTVKKFVSLVGVTVAGKSQVQWMAEAINLNISNGAVYECEDGDIIDFFVNVSTSVTVDAASIRRIYTRLCTGATSVTSVVANDLMPDGSEEIPVTGDLIIELGDIGTDDVWTAFNADPSQPFDMDNEMFVSAVQNIEPKLWQWIGGTGSFGNTGTPAVEADFLDLTLQPVVTIGQLYDPYDDISNLLSSQLTQSTETIIAVTDASDDVNITFPIGETKLWAYYQYLGTPNGLISDYRLVSVPYGNHTSNLTNVFFATDYGTSDADISLGSTSFGTDSLTGLQAMLDEALTRPILIYWDGKFSVSGVLEVHSNTTIIALAGCGVILRNASNSYLLKNKNTVDPSSVGGWNSNIVDENIVIENLILNGNGYNTGTGGDTVFDVANNGSAVNGSAQTKRNQIIDFTGVKNFQLKNLQLLGGRYWASHFANIKDGFINDTLIDFGESSTRDDYNYDGLHMKGGCDNIKVKNIICRNTKDDNIALNSYSQLALYIPQRGPITNIEIDGVYLDGRTMGIGLYSETTPSEIDNIVIRNVTGTTQSHWLRITNGEDGTDDGLGVFGSIIIENITVEVLNGSTLQDFDGYINIRANIDKLILRNVVRQNFEKNNAYICLSQADSVINELIIDGVQMETTGGTWDKAFLKIDAGSIKRCLISNYIHNEETSQINSPVVEVNGGYLVKLMMNNINCSNINTIFNQTGGTVNGIVAGNIGHFESPQAGFKTTETIGRIFLSNYDGITPLDGTFTLKRGGSLDYLGTYLFSSLPSAVEYSGSMLSISDETGGFTRAYSNGVNWLRVYDNAIVNGPIPNILLEEDFTGTTIDPLKGSVTNPDSANLLISQNNKLLFTRVTDVNIVSSTTNFWQSVSSYAKGGALAVLMNQEVGFELSTFSLRWVFNGTIDFIGLQGTSIDNQIRIVIKSANVIVYDVTIATDQSTRVKITYSSANDIAFWRWDGASWVQMGTTQNYNLGASGSVLISTNSIIGDDAGDQFSFDQLRVTNSDYSTELPV